MSHFQQLTNKLRREAAGDIGDSTLDFLSDDEGRRRAKATPSVVADDWSDSSGDLNPEDLNGDGPSPGSAKSKKDGKKLQREEVEHHTWPPTTHSTSRGVFYVTPNTHLQYDPRFRTKATASRSGPHTVPPKWIKENCLWEPTYRGEPPSNISKRMEAFTSAWNQCLTVCSKVVEFHFDEMISDLTRFVHSDHEERNWGLSIIPTAVVVMGVDTSDHPIFYGVLESRLKKHSHAVAVLRPASCRTMSQLMRSMVRQVLVGCRSDSEYSFQSILGYAKSLESFSMTIVVENVEQWSLNQVLSDFLAMTSRYSAPLNLTLILAVSSTSHSVSYILPHRIMQLLASRTFHLAPSSTAIDVILTETILSPSCPFRVSGPVLKWLLETIKFLNHSVSSLVTKLKLMYWRFFSTQTLSWTTVDGFRTAMYGRQWKEISEPFSRRLFRFLKRFPGLDLAYPELAQLVAQAEHDTPFPTSSDDGEIASAVKKAAKKTTSTTKEEEEPQTRVDEEDDDDDNSLSFDADDHEGDGDAEDGQEEAMDAVEEPEIEEPPLLSPAQLEASKILAQFSKWTKMFQSSQLLRSFALTLFMIAKNLIPASPKGNSGLVNAFDFLATLKHHQQLINSLDQPNGSSIGKKRVMPSAAARSDEFAHAELENLQDHSWDACPRPLEYLALITHPADCVRTAMGYLKQNPKSLALILEHWHAAATSILAQPDRASLLKLFLNLFGEALEPVKQIAEQLEEDPSESLEPEVQQFLQRLHLKMEAFIINSFVSSIDTYPFFEDMLFEDVAYLIKRCNPNIQAAQATQTLTLIADIDSLRSAK